MVEKYWLHVTSIGSQQFSIPLPSSLENCYRESLLFRLESLVIVKLEADLPYPYTEVSADSG